MFDAIIGIFYNNLKYNVFFKFQFDKKISAITKVMAEKGY